MRFLIYTLAALVLFAPPSLAQSETLTKRNMPDGIHFGTEADPNKCCYCERAKVTAYTDTHVNLRLADDSVVSVTRSNEFSAADGDTWYCRGEKSAEISYPACALTGGMI